MGKLERLRLDRQNLTAVSGGSHGRKLMEVLGCQIGPRPAAPTDYRAALEVLEEELETVAAQEIHSEPLLTCIYATSWLWLNLLKSWSLSLLPRKVDQRWLQVIVSIEAAFPTPSVIRAAGDKSPGHPAERKAESGVDIIHLLSSP